MNIIRRVPFTITLVALLLVLAISTGVMHGPSSLVREAVGLDLDAISRREWWLLITAEFFADNLAQLVVVLVAAVFALGASERLMGTRRTIIAFAVTGIAASALGLGIEYLGILAGEYWAGAVRGLATIDPLSPILGTLASASAYASVLWRRRIRFVVVAFVVMFVLYSGLPSDVYRLIAVLIGLLLGSILSRQRIHLERWTSSHHETRVLLAAVAAISALGPFITLSAHGRYGLLTPLGDVITGVLPRSRAGAVACTVSGSTKACNDLLASHGGLGFSFVLLALLPLVVLLIGAHGLRLGRRAAVYLVAAVSAADGVLAAVYFGVLPASGNGSAAAAAAGSSPEFGAWLVAGAVLPLAFAALVLSRRRHFPIRAGVHARRRFALTMVLGALAVVGGYLAAGTALAAQFRPTVSFFDLLTELPERFIPVSFVAAAQRDFVPGTVMTRLLYHGVGPLLWILLIIALIQLLRRPRPTEVDMDEATEFRQLARASGGSMSFPGTWVGNSYWFDAERRMGIAYRVANGCAVTTSEPVGSPRSRRESLGQFIRFCDANAFTPVLYGIHEDWSASLVEFGWSTTVIAEETLIDPSTWDTTGKRWQDVRSSVNRAARQGVTVTWSTWHTLGSRMANQIAEISELWVVEKKLPELGFTLGGLDELKDPDVLLGVAADSNGVVLAVTSWLPTWADGVIIGRTLDFMRRRADGMNGVMEFVISEAAAMARADRLVFLSLSGAPLAVAASDERSTPLDRVLGMVGRSLEPVYGFRSLLNFKQKFRPYLRPLFLAYPDAMSLPAIAIAISRCYLPELTWKESSALMRSLR